MGLFGSKENVECSDNPDGTKLCMLYKIDRKGNKVTTGHFANIGADPNNNCEPTFVGGVSLPTDNLEVFDGVAKKIRAQCMKGGAVPQQNGLA